MPPSPESNSTAMPITRFLIEEQRRLGAGSSGGLTALIHDVRLACKRIAALIGKGALAHARDDANSAEAPGERQPSLDRLAGDIFLRTNEWGGQLAGMLCPERAEPNPIPPQYPLGRYLLLFDPLAGSSDIDVNVPVGRIFSVLRCPPGITDPSPEHFLQQGSTQVCAGYAIYGPATMLVLSTGQGVHGFTLDRQIGEFSLTHPNLRIPESASEFAISASSSRHWDPAVRRYVHECLQGQGGPRGRDFNMRWIAALVSEAHRILMRGGVFLYPRDRRDPYSPGRLRLLYAANPIAFLIEQAGGRASTGHGPVLEVQPESLHEQVSLVFGARSEVERIERYHRDHNQFELDVPLFGTRGLFTIPSV